MDILQTVVFLFIIHAAKAKKTCYFEQEPDHEGKLRWVMPGSHKERCSCAVLLPGGVNRIAPKRPYELYYTIQPLFTDDEEMIHDFFDCHVKSMTTTIKTEEHTDCQSWFDDGNTTSGVYPINIQSYSGSKEVYCEMEGGKGWLVFQRRQDGSVNFTRTWLEYIEGFGDVSREFWLGNEALRLLTSGNDGSNWTIRVDLTDEKGLKKCLITSPFGIIGDKYALSIGSSGNELTVNGMCNQRLGMEDNSIPDSSITASSVFPKSPKYCYEGNGRLNQVGGSWCPEGIQKAWIQVDLKIQTQVEGVIMQGSFQGPGFDVYEDGWVKKYKVEYRSHQSPWFYVGGTSLQSAKVFDGNRDHDTPVTRMFDKPVQARFIRIRPTDSNSWPTMRMELIGCKGGDLESLNGRRFSTYDNDNDNDALNCAGLSKAGWWFDDCTDESTLNGEYSHRVQAGSEYRSFRWSTLPGRQIVQTKMKMRRNN